MLTQPVFGLPFLMSSKMISFNDIRTVQGDKLRKIIVELLNQKHSYLVHIAAFANRRWPARQIFFFCN